MPERKYLELVRECYEAYVIHIFYRFICVRARVSHVGVAGWCVYDAASNHCVCCTVRHREGLCSWHFHVLARKLILDCVLRLLTDFLEARRIQGARTVLQTNMSSRRPSSIERKYCAHTHACAHAQAHMLNAVCWSVSIIPTQLLPHKGSMSHASLK